MEQYLDFEQPIYTCLEKIEELKKVVPAPSNLAEEIALLEEKAGQDKPARRGGGRRRARRGGGRRRARRGGGSSCSG